MIGLRTILDVADNSGAKRISLIKVLGGPQNGTLAWAISSSPT